MKKTLKTIISAIIMLVLILNTNFTTYAAATQINGGSAKSNAIDIDFGKEYGLILTSGGTKWFKFTTKSSDKYWYNISINNVSVGNNNGSSGVSGTIYDYFGENLATAYSFNTIGQAGAKLEPNTTYFIAIWGVREGSIKFKLDSVYDQFGETNSQASSININTVYQSSIDARGGLSDNRISDMKNGDVDVVKFSSGKYEKLQLTLSNNDIDYYNTYFEGVCAIVSDSFGQSLSYIEVRPDSNKTQEFVVEKNTVYYIKFFATSGGVGSYKFILKCGHTKFNSSITQNPTCQKEGVKTYSCVDCDYKKTETIETIDHNFKKIIINPTCITEGYIKYKCTMCEEYYIDDYIDALEHNYKRNLINKATLKSNGNGNIKCTLCGDVYLNFNILKPQDFQLSATKYSYNGKAKKPKLTIKDSNGYTLVNGVDYSVSVPKERKNVGKYTYKITFKGNYSGTKSLSFTIVPKATSISSLSAVSKGFTVKWKKQATQTTGYQIQIATDSKFTKGVKSYTVSKNSTVSKKITKLTGKKKYYVRIRTYKTVSGTKYYSSWSGSKTVTTKK